MSHDDAGRKGCWDTESLALVVERQKFPPKKGKGIEKELDSQKTQMPITFSPVTSSRAGKMSNLFLHPQDLEYGRYSVITEQVGI